MTQQSLHLLIGHHFFQDMAKQIATAQQKIDIMFMTFEGDNTGWRLANQLIAAAQRGVTIRVLIDHFTSFWVSDKTALNPATWKEWRQTRHMIRARHASRQHHRQKDQSSGVSLS